MNTEPDKYIYIDTPVEEGRSVGFTYIDTTGIKADGFIFRKDGELHSYRNLCPHYPLPLDYDDAEFFDHEEQYIMCRNHWALFEPKTGHCVSGPCEGACLKKFEVSEENGKIRVDIPEETELTLE